MRLLLLIFSIIFSTGWFSSPAISEARQTCELQQACQLGIRSYHARLPDGWDGKSPLPVLLHFHGWGRQGDLIMKHRRIAGATRKLGVLLLAPNGNGRSWDFWDAETDDVTFAADVLDDAAKRWPIDGKRIFVSGYSYGSAMAWRFACQEGARIHTLLAISGNLRSQTDDCVSPVSIRHVHGTRDTVMGFPFGPNNDVSWPVKLWRDLNRCDETIEKTVWQAVKILPFIRHHWTRCASGKEVTLDVHARGHFIPRFWIERQLSDLLTQTSSHLTD